VCVAFYATFYPQYSAIGWLISEKASCAFLELTGKEAHPLNGASQHSLKAPGWQPAWFIHFFTDTQAKPHQRTRSHFYTRNVGIKHQESRRSGRHWRTRLTCRQRFYPLSLSL
jgi:hypothetical protein